MAKQNPLWRLDILETEYLQKQARYRKTSALLKSKKKKHVLPESKDAALKEIEALKSDIFGNKIHSSFVKYQRALKKAVKALSGKKRTTTDGELEFYKTLDLEEITKVRVVKQVSQVFKISRKKLDTEPESIPKFIPKWLLEDLKLPSNFYNGLTNEQRNWYSKVLNHQDVKEIASVIENSFRLILGPVKEHKKDIEDVQGNDSESDDSEDGSDSDSEDGTGNAQVSQIGDGNKEEEEEEEDYSQYDYLVAGSEDEVEDNQLKFENETSYNSATDIESSDEDDGADIGSEEEDDDKDDDEDEIDDFFEDESKHQKKAKAKESKHVLPSLATGYFSGGESEEIEDDEVAQEIIRPQRKNRRGQRARQKLWEMKYGKDANHFKKQEQAKQQERERKQKEYEERVARRAALGITKSGSNTTPLSQRNGGPSEQKEKLHPSWEAKKRAQESQKKAKFQGKKITFD